MASVPIHLQAASSAPESGPALEPRPPLSSDPVQDPAALDALLDRITPIKATQKQLEAELEPLLDQLDVAFDEGLVDPTFSHNDTSFCWSAGRTTYTYPESLKQREQALKAAQKDAIASGSATARTGQPFWTIRPPRA